MSRAGRFDLTDPAIYQHWTHDVIRFSDQDSNGHVNNTAFAAYIEAGRVAFAKETRHFTEPDERFVIAQVSINFLREAHYPGDLDIGTRVIRIGTKSFTVGSGVFKDGSCLATGESVAVFMKGGASQPLNNPTRQRLETLLQT